MESANERLSAPKALSSLTSGRGNTLTVTETPTEKTADKSGHRCYGVFFDGKTQMLFSSLDTAKAVAERIQDSDF